MSLKHRILGIVIGSLITYVIFQIPLISTDKILLSSLAATIYMIFVIPENYSNNMKKIFGSYLISTVVGIFFSNLIYGLFFSIFISMILITYLRFEHPPALGVSISAVLGKSSIHSIISISIALFLLIVVFLVIKTVSYFSSHKSKSSYAKYIEEELGI